MNVNTSLENLSFGKNTTENSYNIEDILNNINNLINNPEELKHVLESLLGFNEEEPGYAFSYDIKITIMSESPLPEHYKAFLIGKKVKDGIKSLIGTLVNTISSKPEIKNGFQTVLNIYNQWSNQENNKSYTINLKAVKNFLTASDGILTVVNNDLIPILITIFTDPNPLQDAEYFEFYKGIGGQLPENEEEAPLNFRSDSLIDILKKKINEPNEPLSQIIFILLGNNNEQTKGIFNYIIDSNNQWIYDNYKRFFTNKKYYKITDVAIPNFENTKLKSLDNKSKFLLTYKFIYTINNHKYHFDIRCISIDEGKDFTGTKNFYFEKIALTKIEEIK